MRLVAVAYGSADHFLGHSTEANGRSALFCPTRTPLCEDEVVLVEISFPELPNRVVLRGRAISPIAGEGSWIAFVGDDHRSHRFLAQVARGEVKTSGQFTRADVRFPTSLPVVCRVQDEHDRSGALSATTRDLSAGGAFVASGTGFPVGTRLHLRIGEQRRFAVDGTVCWWLAGTGFGVRFDRRGLHDASELRTALRRADESGSMRPLSESDLDGRGDNTPLHL